MKWNQYITDCSALVASRFPRIGPEFCLYAVDLLAFDQGLAFSTQTLLSPEEQHQYLQYRFPKRQKEWLGGRLACKGAVARLAGLSRLQDIIVINNEHGRPMVSGVGCRHIHVSISHSGEWAMALASYIPCGLDLQEVGPSLARVEEKFVCTAEKDLLSTFGGSGLEQLSLGWVVKEALRKQVDIWPLLGFLETRLVGVDVLPEGAVVSCCTFAGKRSLPEHLPVVYATMYNGYGLAFCLDLEKKL